MKKFRPQHFSGRYRLKNPRSGLWNWIPFDTRPYCFLHKVAGVLHYRGCHAPLPIQKKWYPVWKKFEQKYRKIL